MKGRIKSCLVAQASEHRNWAWAAALAFGASVALVAGPASAVNFDLGPDSNLSWTTEVGYTAAYRVDDPDDRILANPNADDGERAFPSGLIQSEISALTEIGFSYKNLGFFIRADGFFNQVYNHNSENFSAATDNTPSNPSYEFVDETEERHRADVRLLDAFVYGNFNLGEMFLSLRVGRQVLSWGESLFLSGIGSTQNPIDVTEAHEPAVEVKSLYLPQGTVLAQLKLTTHLSMAGYYIWNWEKSTLDGTGSYFSTFDPLGGGEVYYLGGTPVPYGGDIEPSNGGQYGVNLHYTVPALNYADFGLYYIRYHAKTPQLLFKGGKYYTKYFDDIDLYGASMSTTLFRYFAIGAEVSYREGRPVLNQSGVAVRADVIQGLLNTIVHSPVELFWSGTTTVSVGMGYNKILDRDENEVSKDLDGARYVASLSLAYPNIAPLLDMTVTPSISHSFYGDSTARAAYNSGNMQLGLDVSFQYLAQWDFGASYVMFRGEPAENGLTDRDFVSAHVKYTF